MTMAPDRAAVQLSVLMPLADFRCAILDVDDEGDTARRVGRWCDGLAAWAALPRAARARFAPSLLDALFEVAADVEEDEAASSFERLVIELSLWEAASELGLASHDAGRQRFVLNRERRLRRLLREESHDGTERLMLAWTDLLVPAGHRVSQLPGPFEPHVSVIVEELRAAGLPRRARNLAGKFQFPIPPLVAWAIEYRPESEEAERTRRIIERVRRPPRPVPYLAWVASRKLLAVLLAPVTALPIGVGAAGIVTVAES